jgi:hypothetical protein
MIMYSLRNTDWSNFFFSGAGATFFFSSSMFNHPNRSIPMSTLLQCCIKKKCLLHLLRNWKNWMNTWILWIQVMFR